jgi:polyadenylate-binding protein
LVGIFSPFGQILSCKIMHDLYSQQSRGFAFVTYMNSKDATEAKNKLNGLKIDGIPLAVNFKRMPSEFKNEANIYVKNLSKQTTSNDLEQLFSQFGKVISCIVKYNDKGESLGYGYVQLDDEQSSLKAIEKLDGQTFHNSQLSLQKFVSAKNRMLHEKTNLYVRNFPSAWDKAKVEEEFIREFGVFGNIASSGVYEHKLHDRTVFFACVAFENETQAQNAILALNNKFLTEEHKKESPLYVVHALPKQFKNSLLSYANTPMTNLLVKSLKPDVTQEQLLEIFSTYGKVQSIVVKSSQMFQKEVPVQLSYAMINYETAEQAQDALMKASKNQNLRALLHESRRKEDNFVSFLQPK